MATDKEIEAANIAFAVTQIRTGDRWNSIKAALEAAELVKDCSDCENYSGIDCDINELVNNIRKAKSLEWLQGLTELNYPREKGND